MNKPLSNPVSNFFGYVNVVLYALRHFTKLNHVDEKEKCFTSVRSFLCKFKYNNKKKRKSINFILLLDWVT